MAKAEDTYKGVIGPDGKPMAQGPGGDPAALTAIFDALNPDEIAALCEMASGVMGGDESPSIEAGPDASAEGAGPGGPPEASETAADEAAESPEEQAKEKAEGTELHDPSMFANAAAAASTEAGQICQQIEDLAEQAKENEGGDPKGLAKSVKEAAKIEKEIDKQANDAQRAAGKDDLGKAATASKLAADSLAELKTLLADAKGMVEIGRAHV